jgi:hypothetical protein
MIVPSGHRCNPYRSKFEVILPGQNLKGALYQINVDPTRDFMGPYWEIYDRTVLSHKRCRQEPLLAVVYLAFVSSTSSIPLLACYMLSLNNHIESEVVNKLECRYSENLIYFLCY